MLKRLQIIAPALLFSLLFLFLALLRTAGFSPLPLWLRAIIGVLWIGSLLQYVFALEMQKQIGGWASVVLTAFILWAMLTPFGTIEQTPSVVASSMDHGFRAAWESVHTGVVFENFSPKASIRSYIASLGRLDPFRMGRILAFALLGFFLSACFIYPISMQDRQKYLRRLGLLLSALVFFAVQTELAQVLSPTRKVTIAGSLIGVTGVALGIALLVALQGVQTLYFSRHPKTGRRFNTLGVAIDAITMRDCLEVFEEAIESASANRPVKVAPMGVAGIMQARRDPHLQRILNNTRLNTPDGMPLVWLGQLHGFRDMERVYGPDMMQAACAAGIAKGWTHYFYGAAPGVTERLKTNFEKAYPGIRILGTESPPYRPLTEREEQELIERINRLQPDFFWIGISTPKQLYLMGRLESRLRCGIICPVGYAFDVCAGMQAEAPEWIKLAGFQWLHRLVRQPRLWKRYLPDNPRFVCEVLLQLTRIRKYPIVK